MDYLFWSARAMRQANTVSTILGFTSTMSSGKAYTLAPIFLLQLMANFALLNLAWNHTILLTLHQAPNQIAKTRDTGKIQGAALIVKANEGISGYKKDAIRIGYGWHTAIITAFVSRRSSETKSVKKKQLVRKRHSGFKKYATNKKLVSLLSWFWN